ncbi:MAG: sugar transferase [Armatimonadota bacterium]|nr:sugar transferase [bacterium]
MNPYTGSLVKRLFDLTCAAVGLLMLLPLMVVISLLIVLGDGRPVLFAQERVGRGGSTFKMLKFRTMVVNAESRGGQLTVGADARVTWLGAFLRKSKVDELPQLFNVVLGDMSLVGPRPEVPRYVELYTPEQREVLRLPPGITDPASIKYRSEGDILANSPDPEQMYIEKVMPDKIRLNLQYALRSSLITDCGLVLKTLVRLFKP